MQKYFVTSKSNKHVERLLENILLLTVLLQCNQNIELLHNKYKSCFLMLLVEKYRHIISAAYFKQT